MWSVKTHIRWPTCTKMINHSLLKLKNHVRLGTSPKPMLAMLALAGTTVHYSATLTLQVLLNTEKINQSLCNLQKLLKVKCQMEVGHFQSVSRSSYKVPGRSCLKPSSWIVISNVSSVFASLNSLALGACLACFPMTFLESTHLKQGRFKTGFKIAVNKLWRLVFKLGYCC